MNRRSFIARFVIVPIAIIASLSSLQHPTSASDTVPVAYQCSVCANVTKPLPEPPSQCPNCGAGGDFMYPVVPQ